MILDACCGAKEMYKKLNQRFNDDEIIYMDVRRGVFSMKQWNVKDIIVKPTVQADIKHLPFRNKTFSLIMFDPPHGGFNLDTWMGTKYGGLNMQDYKMLLVWANIEFERVLERGGIIMAKIQEVEERERYLMRNFSNFKMLIKIRYKSQGTIRKEKLYTAWHLYVKKLLPSQLKPCEVAPQPQVSLDSAQLPPHPKQPLLSYLPK